MYIPYELYMLQILQVRHVVDFEHLFKVVLEPQDSFVPCDAG